jgi:hypothetical protein
MNTQWDKYAPYESRAKGCQKLLAKKLVKGQREGDFSTKGMMQKPDKIVYRTRLFDKYNQFQN